MLKLSKTWIGALVARRLAREGVFGVDPLIDIATRAPSFTFRCIFDVGANAGQTSLRYSRLFPQAAIYAFEPGPSAFKELRQATIGKDHIHCFEVAVGAAPGGADFLESANSPMSRLSTNDASRALKVAVISIDDVCAKRQLPVISYLKIDAEGHELEVLKGADRMLREGRISFVEAECGLNAQNTYHVPFEVIKRHLEGYGFHLFGVYRQVEEWPTGQRHLRRANAVFIDAGETSRDR